MEEFIKCDFIEARGPAWGDHTAAQTRQLIKKIHEGRDLHGWEPKMYGFVGTRKIKDSMVGDIVGGYFAVQYADKAFQYDKKKKLVVVRVKPFARMFFLFFAKTGKCLLQNTRFDGLPLTYSEAKTNFHLALNRYFQECKMDKLISLAFVRTELLDSQFRKMMRQSTRVSRIKVASPSSRSIPQKQIYYNPQVDRNEIIRQSHQHDYAHLKRIELEVKDNADIRDLHLVDMMHSGTTEEMDVIRGDEKITLRRKVINKFTFNIDMEAEELPKDQFETVIQQLRQSGALV
jgi:hypothetical protein